MSHKILKPLSIEERANFIVEYNHNQGLLIEETETAMYALEPWEKLEGNEVIDNTEAWKEKQAQEREEQFNKDFFNTSLGYIRRKVSMATGETKDFLSDLLPTISMGIQMGNPVQIITYDKPDFMQEVTDWTSLQSVKTVTAEFVQECFLQLSNDFKPVEDTSDQVSEQVSDQVTDIVTDQVEVQDDNTT